MTFHGTVDWFGQTSPWAPEMALELEDGRLRFQFRASKKANCNESLQRGEFVEGLWEQDVAELFLAGPGERYQEINVSPTGAWWCARFNGYRQRVETARFPVEIQVERNDTSWQVLFSARVADLDAWQGLEQSERRASPTAILHGPDPAYFAWNWNPTKSGDPDFHRKDLLKPLSWESDRQFWP
jgi:hypothetical protein